MTPHRFAFAARLWANALATALAGALALAGCAGGVATQYFSLMQQQDAGAPAGAAARIAIVLEPLSVPAQVNQPQWLLRQADGSLVVLEQTRWAAPLRDEVRGALLQALAKQIGAAEQRGGEPPKGWRVHVEITHWQSRLGQDASLAAAWSVRPARGQPALAQLICLTQLHESVGSGFAALAEGHARTVRALAAKIGEALSALEGGREAQCG